MKSKYRNELKIINYITTTDKYKAIFFTTLILCLYGGFILGTSANNFFDSILVPLQFPIFNVFFFSIIFINNLNVCSILKKDFSFYTLRLKNKKEYIKFLLRVSAIMFLFHIIIIFLILFTCLFLTTFNNVEIYNYQNYFVNYGINNLTFCCFYCIRYILFGLLITIISSLIYINAGQKTAIVINIIFLILMFYLGGTMTLYDSFSLLIWSYFTSTMYTTFSLELSSSVFMVLILEIIILSLYHISKNNKRIEIS